jgi:hypothetical protein
MLFWHRHCDLLFKTAVNPSMELCKRSVFDSFEKQVITTMFLVCSAPVKHQTYWAILNGNK